MVDQFIKVVWCIFIQCQGWIIFNNTIIKKAQAKFTGSGYRWGYSLGDCTRWRGGRWSIWAKICRIRERCGKDNALSRNALYLTINLRSSSIKLDDGTNVKVSTRI